VEYPTNNVGKFYEDFLSKENVQFDKDAFEAAATKGAYRQLIAVPTNFDCKVQVYENSIDAEFQFDLDKGSYATMLLRELMLTTICRRVNGS
jgi:tRNA(Glu) U13 pseudouridine synthase TruD